MAFPSSQGTPQAFPTTHPSSHSHHATSVRRPPVRLRFLVLFVFFGFDVEFAVFDFGVEL